MKKLLISLLATLALSANAALPAGMIDDMNGSDLTVGYAMAIVDMDKISTKPLLCIPSDSITPRQINEVVVNFVKANPKVRTSSAAVVSLMALSKVWPCPIK